MQRPHRNFSRHGGRGPPPSNPQPPVDNNPNFLYQNPAPHAQFPPQPYPYSPYFQNPNPQFQDPNLYLQLLASLAQHPSNFASLSGFDDSQRPNPSTPIPTPKQNPNPPVQNQSPKFPIQRQNQQRNLPPGRREALEKIEIAVQQARRELIASAENVSTWKVSQSALVKLKADSWDSLGFQLQEVPSLYRFIVIEGKINAFIHCFVAVRTVTSLYDLEVAICENEGIEKFEELELGPLVRHPLIEHYFSSKDMTEVYNITGEDIISYLKMFVAKLKGKSFQGNDFLEYVAKRCKVCSWETMGLRIQSLGKHIGFIRAAMHRENALLKMCKSSGAKRKKRPLFSLEKKVIDERYNAITQRVASFSSAHKDFLGKHTRFISSSSDDDDYDDDKDEPVSEQRADYSNKQKEHALQNARSDKASSCPYPSVAEEMTRLGLRGETNCTSSIRNLKEDAEPVRKKRKLEQLSCTIKHKAYTTGTDLALANDSIRMFITTWKEACCQHTATEVFEKMLQFYELGPKEKRKIKALVSKNPFLGMLNVAVMSIKNGTWDSIYDTFQSFDELGCTNTHIEHESLDIEPRGKDLLDSTNQLSEFRVTVEDIIRKMTEFFADGSTLSEDGNSLLQTAIILARKLLRCEVWLNQQFCVKQFDSLGYGEYFTFLEKHASLLPKVLHDNLKGQVHEQISFEVSLLKEQLIVLLSQASDSLWEDGIITKQRIASLLSRQFPFVNFSVLEKGCLNNFQHTIKEYKNSIASNCVLFSATLLGTFNSGDSLHYNESCVVDGTGVGAETGRKAENPGSFMNKDVVEVLVRAPMLIDLNSWLHWDVVYAPSLGPLLKWLLTEVNAKDLLCLLTRDGKIIRIDPSASVDSFFKALLKGSPFRVAVELLSLFALLGGRRHMPLSLLKCRARQAFEVLLTSPMDRGQCYEWNCLTNEETSMNPMINESSGFTSGISICMKHNDVKEATTHASRLVLDCLGFLPSEFCSLAAEILLSGLQSVVKYAPATILLHCKSKEEHLMLHDIGFTLGIKEWIDDHQKVCPIIADQSCMSIRASPSSSLSPKVVGFEYQEQVSDKNLLPEEIPSTEDDREYESDTNFNSSVDGLEINNSVREGIQDAAQVEKMKDAALLVELIRREEFGLASDVESSILKKQHARLGRALHCLSHELYSQDSHFFLELIQNADDNAYHKEVEPTLMFILQNTRIIVLNNEKGFTPQNIKALCDVGNSTKKGSSSGYIGQKGIGFKSVFRVTDAPEIHSNGFHIKFDITQGQIGFVLPTIVPPFNIDLIRQLTSAPPDQMDTDCWNTCIVLPFRSKLTQGIEMGKIISMFSEIHPSLLLFLHRLQCIKLMNMLDNTFFSMTKEIVGDGLVKVSYGENTMTWFIASKKLHAEIIRPGVKVTEISIAFTLKESEKGNYEPHLEQQPVFAFLPLRTYGLKFILQGDFVLPSSREEVDADSPWNQWLLSEFPDLFVSAEKSFCTLPCFRESPGKAVTAYMHFVPLIGEVQGFFYGLPRMIISGLRQSDCLLEEGCNKVWVPPCKVLRSWNERARVLLPDVLLQEHLGLGFLNKDIILSDTLARALGVQDYGPKILIQFLSSICCAENGLKSMGLRWLSSWLNELHIMLHSPGKPTENASLEMDLISSLRKIPFVPLSDGTYGSIYESTIWLNIDSITTGSIGVADCKGFPTLYASLRIVNPDLFSVTDDAFCMDDNFVNNIASLLHKIGVQHLTAHQIIKAHILPIISDDKIADREKSLFIECNAFVMLHLQSSCADCRVEKEGIISELCSKAFLLTNHGFKRLTEATIHFGKEFGNCIDAGKFFSGMDYKWHEIDVLYLKHPLTGSISCGLIKWRDFFHSLGVTDFVKVTQIEKKISDVSPIIFQQMKWDRDLISSGMLVMDWESEELDSILSSLARNGNPENSKYLLEVLDSLWDDYFIGKTACYFSCKSGESNTSFRSTLMNNICDARWVTSTMDDELHYPRELFHDCDAVRSILGTSAPYAVPKIRNEKLLADIGLKTQVTIEDILASLEKWRKLKPFKASISQMSRLYTSISKELATSKEKVLGALSSGPFIFVPSTTGVSREDVVVGSLLSPEEVYWHDYSGALDSMKQLSSLTPNFPMSKLLSNIYPGLRDFFVDDCGVNETPPFRCFLQILKQLSMSTSPLQAASVVFQVFLRWSDGLRCGAMVDDDIYYLRDQLLQLEFAVLPAMQDKWVSLHPSFGLICWCDDDSLKKQFKHLDNIEFLYFGELTNDEKEMLQTKVSILMQKLGIPALSEVVTREAIYYGPSDNSFKASLVAWALPYAQRYIYTVHSEKYAQLKLSGFERLLQLKIVVVEKLFYRNVVKKCSASSKKRSECSCVLQDTVLYTTQESDSHSLFMELSRLFFDGVSELHLANFLHMLTTMAESGSTEEQMEFFILNSQKMPKIPDKESVWALSSPPHASEENDQAIQMDVASTFNEQNFSLKSKNKKGSLCWPPAGWKTAPGFDYGYLRTRGPMTRQGFIGSDTDANLCEVPAPTADSVPTEINEDYIIEDAVQETVSFSDDVRIPDASWIPRGQPGPVSEQPQSMAVPTNVVLESHCPEEGVSRSIQTSYQLMTPDAQQAVFAGRVGEFVAFRHFKDKLGTALVNWVNEQNETGLPYDIVIGEKESSREFIEVKATRYASKNWFKISNREWQFAVEKGNCYSIAHIVLSNTNTAKVTIYKNPVKLCQLGKLDLAVMMPRQQQSGSSAPQ